MEFFEQPSTPASPPSLESMELFLDHAQGSPGMPSPDSVLYSPSNRRVARISINMAHYTYYGCDTDHRLWKSESRPSTRNSLVRSPTSEQSAMPPPPPERKERTTLLMAKPLATTRTRTTGLAKSKGETDKGRLVEGVEDVRATEDVGLTRR